ncbi:MAG: GGDEF domain-containing protein [Endomicrobiaceae bacterium]|nr:GGDEF domain-containing protein [Endomicrobiaceae bacterium]
MAPIAVFFARDCKWCLFFFWIVINATAFLTFGYSYLTLLMFAMSFILVLCINYFLNPSAIDDIEMQKNNELLRKMKEQLEKNQEITLSKRKILEKKLENIMQLYVISKDLTTKITIEDTTKMLTDALSSKPGIFAVAIVVKRNGNLTLMSCSKQELIENCIATIKNNANQIEQLTGSQRIDFLYPIANKAVISWTIRLNNDFLSSIFLAVEEDFIQNYVDEGKIFLPHLTLSAKRVLLFSQLNDRARVDGLTGLYLRRYFMERLHTEIQVAKRYKTDFYIMMLDIDFFKKVNDTYGHVVGDKVLSTISKIITSSVRPGDIIGRYGGEEFIVILPMALKKQAIEIAEKIRKNIQTYKFIENNISFSATISIGVTKYTENLNEDNLISIADNALYQAKKEGRNKVVLI